MGKPKTRHNRTSKKGKVFPAGKGTKKVKVPIGKKIKSTLAGIFQGFVPSDLRDAVVLEFQTHTSILGKYYNELEQEKGTRNRPNKIKEIKSEIKHWAGRVKEDKIRIKYLAKKYNLDYSTLIKSVQWVSR